jgi:hypothetical protein
MISSLQVNQGVPLNLTVQMKMETILLLLILF